MATGSSICVLLKHNPHIDNQDLAGVVRGNLVGFKGTVKVTKTNYAFASGNKEARVIYITPYGSVGNFFIDLKRTLVGVEFPAPINNTNNLITNYVLGLLVLNSQEYMQAQHEAEQAWEQGRRFIVAIATDCSTLSVVLEENSSGTCSII